MQKHGKRQGGRRKRWPPFAANVCEIAGAKQHGSRLLRSAQRLAKSADDVAGRFQADGKAHHVLADAGRGELLRVHLLVRGARGMDDERLGVADVGEVARELQRLDELARPPARPPLMPKLTIEPAPLGSSRCASS